MQHLLPHLAAMAGKRVLVIGDLMLDEYLFGEVERISPEAPVPVVSLRKRSRQLGGAANVALGAQQLGAEVRIIGLRGADADGEALAELLVGAGLNDEGIYASVHRRTTRKARVMSQGQQLLRVDTEDAHPSNDEEFARLWRFAKAQLDAEWPEVIILQDYDKGTFTPELIQGVVARARRNDVLTVVDPKSRNFWSYGGVSLFKPNLKEVSEALSGERIDSGRRETLDAADERLRERLKHHASLITLGAAGAYLSDGETPLWEPAHERAIADVCGAGDSVAAAAALALAVQAPPEDVLALANLAGGLACEHLGVRPLRAKELRRAILGSTSVGERNV